MFGRSQRGKQANTTNSSRIRALHTAAPSNNKTHIVTFTRPKSRHTDAISQLPDTAHYMLCCCCYCSKSKPLIRAAQTQPAVHVPAQRRHVQYSAASFLVPYSAAAGACQGRLSSLHGATPSATPRRPLPLALLIGPRRSVLTVSMAGARHTHVEAAGTAMRLCTALRQCWLLWWHGLLGDSVGAPDGSSSGALAIVDPRNPVRREPTSGNSHEGRPRTA